jgi:hypothetical protein
MIAKPRMTPAGPEMISYHYGRFHCRRLDDEGAVTALPVR